MRKKLIKTAGIILRSYDYAEDDKILKAYTNKLGKISILAKGAKKIKNKFSQITQQFSQINFLLYQGKNLFTISQTEILNSYSKLKTNLELFAVSSYFCELVDLITIEKQIEPRIFILLLKSFLLLGYQKNIHLITRNFEFQLLKIAGYSPKWENSNLSLTGKLICKFFFQDIDLSELSKKIFHQQLIFKYEEKEYLATGKNNQELANYLQNLWINLLQKEIKSLKFLKVIS